ncbi:nucleotidyl transferase AbiEii/AbiGii toxin family protein [Halomonas sp. M5N1S17]|uniref:nucleotidyl transferase AbiEii/AbiGii toxin family protein n=1 Tax=Halomonas alkalisoli TaxID=2907158 RepID=UPI001F343511|nr:nucleotidyl transferase AbiEii/AbiGii toxin family protein [Halomonas alkalisoli]MCE9663457.1 nucleotidyl transferase AbiEii/AbiGii toxin family protein [Halomonas alkalisoli]
MRIEPEDFEALVTQAMQAPGHQTMRPVIEKELLHYDMLFALEQEALLESLTFQGGTSLRLCHGASRFSEDLDFVGGRHFAPSQVTEIKRCLEHYISRRYQLDVLVKQPSELRQDPDYADIRVDKWQLSIVTAPARRDVPKQRIKLEIANVPAYTREPRPLLLNYDFLPDGYRDTLVMMESLDEIMADKLVSLVNNQRYIRHRDIWDLAWLVQQNASIDISLLRHKLEDYRVENYVAKAKQRQDQLSAIVQGRPFQQEMVRFLPHEVLERTLHKTKFSDYLADTVAGLIGKVVLQLDDDQVSEPPPPFQM